PGGDERPRGRRGPGRRRADPRAAARAPAHALRDRSHDDPARAGAPGRADDQGGRHGPPRPGRAVSWRRTAVSRREPAPTMREAPAEPSAGWGGDPAGPRVARRMIRSSGRRRARPTGSRSRTVSSAALGSSPPRVAEAATIAHSRRACLHGATRSVVLGALGASAVPGGAVTVVNGRRAGAPVEREGT